MNSQFKSFSRVRHCFRSIYTLIKIVFSRAQFDNFAFNGRYPALTYVTQVIKSKRIPGTPKFLLTI